MKNKAMKNFCLALSMALTVTSMPFSGSLTANAQEQEIMENAAAVSVNGLNQYGLADRVEDGTILHCWCWNFKEMKDKIPEIAAAGFSTIQTSPICQVLVGENGGLEILGQGKWYYHYQPTDYVVGNYQLGTEEEFKAMCAEAHKYGVKVIVDSVLNHCTSDYASISANIINLEGGAFHEMNRPEGQNWSEVDRYEETQYDLSGLYELNTQNKNVQNYILTFLKKCVEDGADGFRYDAAKLIELPDDTSEKYGSEFASDFWPTILQNGASFQYGEVLQEGGNHVYKDHAYYNRKSETSSTDTDYVPYDDSDSSRLAAYQSQTFSYQGETKHMNTTNSFTGFRIRDAVTSKNLDAAFVDNFLLPQGASEDRVVTWVESHDNYCNDSSYAELDRQQVIQAWAVIAARKGGTPLFFDRPDNATARNPWGNNKIGPEGSDMYKDPQVVAVNFFRNEMGDQAETITNPIDGNKEVVMIERGDDKKGCVIVNVSDQDAVIHAATGMADGTYTDQVYGETFTAAEGVLDGVVKAGKVAVVYNPAIDDESKVAFEPAVSLSVPGGYFLTDTIDVNITVRGCDSAQYQIGDKQPVSCNNATTVTIGDDMAVDDEVTVKVTGYDSKQTKVAEAEETYTKRKAKGTTVAYFNKAAQSSWNEVYVYVYAQGGSVTNGGWPGVKAEKTDGNLYRYVLPFELEALEDCKVIFNSGSGSQLPDKEIAPETQMLYTAGGDWVVYDENAARVDLNKPSGNFVDPFEVILSVTGCVSANYILGNADPVACKDGDVVSIGENMQEGESITLTLTGEDKEGESVETSATYTKKSYQGSTILYVDPEAYPDWKNLYVHVYSGTTINKGWPGEKMELDEKTGYYTYVMPYELEAVNSNAIFNNGSGGDGNQTGDLAVKPGDSKLLNSEKQWIDFIAGNTIIYLDPASSKCVDADPAWQNYYAYIWTDNDGDNASWPGEKMTKGANGIYYYVLPDKFDELTGHVIFNNGSGEGTNQFDAGVIEGGQKMIWDSENTWKSYEASSKPELPYDPEDLVEGAEKTIVSVQGSLIAEKAWEHVYAYAYYNDGKIVNKAWPGEELEADADGNYSYELPESLKALKGVQIIFNNNSGDQLGNLTATPDKQTTLTETGTQVAAIGQQEAEPQYDPEDLVEGVDKTVVSVDGKLIAEKAWEHVYAYVYYNDGKIVNKAWPGEELEADADGNYTYELPESLKALKGVQIIFNDGADGKLDNLEATPDKQTTLTETGTQVEALDQQGGGQQGGDQQGGGQQGGDQQGGDQQGGGQQGGSQQSETPAVTDLGKAVITLTQMTYIYDGQAKTPAVTVSVDGKTLTPSDYTVSYTGNTNAGTAAAVVTGKGNYSGTKTQNFTIEKAQKSINVKNAFDKAYGAKAFSLGATVTGGEQMTFRSSDKKVVTVNADGKVTIKGTGKAVVTITSAESANYQAASAKVTIKVAPKKAALSSAKSKKSGQITVKWKKDAKATGYIITYATNKNFKGAKTVTVKSNKTTSRNIKAVKGRKYYVKVCAYKTIDKKKVQGAFSKTKTVTVK